MKQKVWAILVVSLVVVAGTTFFILGGNKDEGTNRTYLGGTAGCLQVYGNANNDYTIDSNDKALILNLISDKEIDWKKNYPFADANGDNELTDADVEYVDRLINASPSKRAIARVVCYSVDFPDGYVEEVSVPVTNASFNFAATTIMALGSIGLVNEMCAATRTATWSTVSDPVFYSKYAHFTDDAHCMGIGTGKVDVTLAANFVKMEDPMTCYILSSGNNYDYYKNRDSVEKLGVSTVQIDDGAINPLKYASGILLLGYLFGTQGNNYAEKSHAVADWMADFDAYMKSNIDKLNAKSIPKKSCVVSTAANYVSSTFSSYSKDVDYYGMVYGIDDSAGTASSMLKYNPSKGDNWLNNYNIDIPIVNTGKSTDEWRWYDPSKDPLKAPSSLMDSVETFKTLRNYKDTIVICASMPAPFRAIFIMELAYPDLFDKDSIGIDKLEEFCVKFYGWSENCLDGVELTYRPSELKVETKQ